MCVHAAYGASSTRFSNLWCTRNCIWCQRNGTCDIFIPYAFTLWLLSRNCNQIVYACLHEKYAFTWPAFKMMARYLIIIFFCYRRSRSAPPNLLYKVCIMCFYMYTCTCKATINSLIQCPMLCLLIIINWCVSNEIVAVVVSFFFTCYISVPCKI